jgi:Txe/YoeB family toxin of Txe-Axe toxin-antitoxin module
VPHSEGDAVQRPPKGTCKPEKLKRNLQVPWSQRLSQTDRVICRFDEEAIYISTIGDHYADR